MTHLRRLIAISSALALLIATQCVASPASAQVVVKKKYMTFYYTFAGACDDLEFTEEEYDSGEDCYVTIQTYPKKPKRTMKLQWWDDESLSWVTEDSQRTNKKGRTVLSVDPMGCDGFCDGDYDYRIYAPRSGKWVSATSWDTITITFTPNEVL